MSWAPLVPAAGTFSVRVRPENTPFNSVSSCEQAALPTRSTSFSARDCRFLVAQNSGERTSSALRGSLLDPVWGDTLGICADAVNTIRSDPRCKPTRKLSIGYMYRDF